MRCDPRGIGVEGIRVVAERGDGDAVPLREGEGVFGLALGEASNVEMRDTGEFALRFSDGPAHDLDAGEGFIASEAEDFLER